MYDVTITDTLASSLVYVSATDIGPDGFAITDNTVLPGNVNLVIPQILAGQQAIIELRTRVDNTVNANAGNTFVNTATYTFANTPAGVPILGGSDTTASTLTIVEPVLAVAKSVANTTKPGLPPDAGDILRYTVTLTASGGAAPGDQYSNAYDVSLDDSLSLGLLYIDGTETVTPGSTIDLPVKVGDGITTPQSLSWSLAQQTVSRLISRLIDRGALRQGERISSGKRGQLSTSIEIVPEFAYSFGVAIFLDALAVTVMDFPAP